MANYHHFLLLVVMLVRFRERERERGRDGCEMLSEQGADEVEAVEISREIKPYFHQHGNVTTSTMTEGESIICKGNRFD